MLLTGLFFTISHRTTAQDSSYETARIDSLAKVQLDKREDAKNLSDLKSERKATKAKAKEAQRVVDDADDAARESKIAYRKEKQAQKSREQADKQARKAAKARRKSDKN